MTKSAQKQPHAELVVLPGWADCLRVLVVARAVAQSRSPWCGLRVGASRVAPRALLLVRCGCARSRDGRLARERLLC